MNTDNPLPLNNNPAKASRNFAITQQRAEGIPIPQIATDNNLTERAVYNVLKRKDSKDILNKVYTRYIMAAKGIGKRFIALCYSKDEAIATRNIAKYHDIMGFSPSHAQSLYLTNIFMTAPPSIPPDVLGVLEAYIGDNYGAIEAEYEVEGEADRENE